MGNQTEQGSIATEHKAVSRTVGDELGPLVGGIQIILSLIRLKNQRQPR
jgi:hypothetical protein